ncbi:MAG: hypothetical protein CL613_06420 [Aquimarina sp.]|nr:hypothetical protein [Aquimarina sp.]
MKKLVHILGITLFLSSLISCSSDDDNMSNEELRDQSQISQDDLNFLHNGNSKKWKITAYYSSYSNQIMDSDKFHCTRDDIYTFYEDQREALTEFGFSYCSTGYDYEISGAVYSYYPESKTLFLDFTRGGYSEIPFYTSSSTLKILKCQLLTKDKMIFTNGSGNSEVGVVFEKAR